MKRVLIIMCIVCLGLGHGQVFAQWKDDIYYNSEDAKKEEEQQAAREQERMRRQQQRQNFSEQPGDGYGNDGGDYVRTYDSDDYIDYDDDPSYYATNIRRFNYPFHNMGFYSTFYDPYWYNPYWVDPYWGWSWWGRPGFSMSMGWGGPYWSSYWGWHTWYGYPGYYSGWGMGGWGGYYSGYWNGYYAGMYNGGGWGGGRAVTYGPRYSANGNYNTSPRRSNPRAAGQGGGVVPQQSPVTSGSFQRRGNPELQRAAGRDNVNLRNNTAPSPRNVAPGARTTPAQRNGGQVVPNRSNTQTAPGRRQFIREDQGTTPVPNRNIQQVAPQRNARPPQQRIMNQPQRQPMSQPRMSAPQRSGGGNGSMFRGGGSGGGSRSFGGSTGGSRGGGGGRR